MVQADRRAHFRRRIDRHARCNAHGSHVPRAAARVRKAIIAAAAAALLHGPAFDVAAQAFPAKPIRLLIPASPGGGTDAIARVLAESLSGPLKQPVVAEN